MSCGNFHPELDIPYLYGLNATRKAIKERIRNDPPFKTALQLDAADKADAALLHLIRVETYVAYGSRERDELKERLQDVIRTLWRLLICIDHDSAILPHKGKPLIIN